ncbi:hypothetical protein [Lishizhenia sp.]|uniref:hypothetical protein n=1 Tax=Lishizhenia sp. TaxID=2497594 RepID=UPI00299F2E4D|nr:hypothetical protein [Lishizhenia sp.]MDX1444565.1 hypothetical protein [Lishizhenia sp.]
MKKQNLKTRHFLMAYLACLVSSIFIAIPVTGRLDGIGAGLFVALIALITSSPFIILFLILIHQKLKKENTKLGLHMYTFILHTAGALLTLLVFFIFLSTSGELKSVFLFILGYYTLDTIFFHGLIQVKFKPNYDVELDTLDSFGQSKEIEF